MAWEGPQVKVPALVAGEDLSEYQYSFVTLDPSVPTPPTVLAVTAANDRAIGILQNNPRVGEEAEVTFLGISKVRADENLAVGESIGVGYPDGIEAQVGGQASKITSGATLGTVLLGANAQAVATVTVNCTNQTR